MKTKENQGMEWGVPAKRKEETDWKESKILGRKNAKF